MADDAAAAQKMADDAADAQKMADDAADAQKMADDAIKVQPSLPYCFFVHIIDNNITYLIYFQIFKALSDVAKSKNALSTQLYEEYLYCKDNHFDGAIACALMERRFDDAKALRLQKARPEYETSVALTDEIKLRMEELLNLLTVRYGELAQAVEIEDCEICEHYLNIMKRILRL